MTDDETKDVYYISAAQLEPYAGDLFVSTEDDAHFWVFAPQGGTLRGTPLANALPHHGHGLEGAIYLP